MAEPVYKKITELDTLSASLDGNETLPVVKSGKTYKRSWANFFGSGWITSLLGAFTAFKAPDADHADDADTVEGESPAQLHNAANLTGAVPLASIPAELTGKNAATASRSIYSVNAYTINSVGSCAFCVCQNLVVPGDQVDGSLLWFAGFDNLGNITYSYGSHPTGTWVCLGYATAGGATLFARML